MITMLASGVSAADDSEEFSKESTQLAPFLIRMRSGADADVGALIQVARGLLDVDTLTVSGHVRGDGSTGSLFSHWAGTIVTGEPEEGSPTAPKKHDIVHESIVAAKVRVCIEATQARPLSARQRELFCAIAPSLARCAHVEYDLASSRLGWRAFEAALVALRVPAFLIDETGHVVRANAHGQALVASDPTRVTRELADCVSDDSHKFATTIVRQDRESASYVLAVLTSPAKDTAARLELATAHWGLTKRQAEVLGRLALGESNKAIAAHLKCADNTVELHVSRLFVRAQVECRAALVAAFWTLRA